MKNTSEVPKRVRSIATDTGEVDENNIVVLPHKKYKHRPLSALDYFNIASKEFVSTSSSSDSADTLQDKNSNLCNKDGVMPLMGAVLSQDAAEVAYWITRKADVNYQDRSGNTPLNIAILLNGIEIVRILVEAGTDTNRANNNGYTALKYAIKMQSDAMVKELLEVSDIENTDASSRSKSAIAYAREMRVESIIALLEEEMQRRELRPVLK